ncbi:PREDICTED: pre-mRNA-processing protein 40C [Nelumbo nucifera]|uniref:Pre-mRNA-processing protein 40C n=2 Tax=Nelumbo nucifera TaxID=4432 RepID=A0A822YWW3_NELNU|nr:PREDICTED: pre-mRNA-processing protein 40C [Nelumbo nucifera]DAD36021.1 TPA_asm: hypothetical protein HUJ06_006661 [Nelumbo nucifera]
MSSSQELQSSASGITAQASGLGQATGPSNPTVASPAPVSGPSNPKGPSGTTNEPAQESIRAKFITGPGYVVPAPSFSYSVIPKQNTASGSSLENSSSPALVSNQPASATAFQPSIPGQSLSSGPTFSYNIIPPAKIGSSAQQKLQSSTDVGSGPLGHSQVGNSTPSTTAASLQPPVPGQPGHPNTFGPGTGAQFMASQGPSPVSVPKGAPSIATSFSFNRIPQLAQKDLSSNSSASVAVAREAGTVSPASSSSVPVSMPFHVSPSSLAAATSPNLCPATLWMPVAPSFVPPPGMPITPGTPGPPGIAPSTPLSSTVTVNSEAMDSSSSTSLRPVVPSTVQQQMHSPYPALPSMPPPPQGLWLPPQIGGLQRPPFLPYPGVLPGSYPLPMRGMPLPSVPVPDSQPPGISPLGPPGGTPSSSVGSVHLPSNTTGKQPDLPPPGTDQHKHIDDLADKVGATVNAKVDAWTAHKTETGVVYYYNALTGESTYERPSEFHGEPDKVTVQPTPVSCEKLVGTDWALVTTNDGKKYYYNSKTKISSWQVPMEVTELRRKYDDDALKGNMTLVQNSVAFSEKLSAPISVTAPAINTGGREATSLRPSGVAGSSSALDLIKKKLQDSIAPATSSPLPTSSGPTTADLNGSRPVEAAVKGLQSENKDKVKDINGDGNISDSSSDSEDEDSGPSKEECIIQFKEMLKERGVAPFSKWEKELPKIVFDPRFKAVPGYSARRALFEHYVRTRAEEERKEKRAAQKAAIEGFKQLLEEASEDIDQRTDYQTFKMKWGSDPRFEALDRKERELLLNERVLPLKKAAEEKAQAIRAAAASGFKSLLREKGDINTSSRWSRVKDSLRSDPRYKSVKHEDRELLFNEYISELKAADEEAEREAKVKREEEDKLKEREREMRKRKEREEQEMERVRLKVQRKEAVACYQALLVETIKDPQVSWTESRPRLEKDPQGRATNSVLDSGDAEKLFREHVKILYERCAREFRTLLCEVITTEAASQMTNDGKTVLTSWSTAKRLLKTDPRYSKMPRKEREALWRRHAEEILWKKKLVSDPKEEKLNIETKARSSLDSGRSPTGLRRSHSRR